KGIDRLTKYLANDDGTAGGLAVPGTNLPDNTRVKSTIPGKLVFELFDTYGFPADLTNLIARENNWQIDEPGFEAEMQQQKFRSRAATTVDTEDWITIKDTDSTDFVGY